MSNEDNKPSLQKDIGELLILAIYLFAEVWAFWEVSHALCLFLAWLGMLALALYDGRLSIRRITVAAATVAILLAAIDLIVPPIPPPEPWRGWLQPANDPTPPNACDRFGKPAKDDVTILLGSSALIESHEMLQFEALSGPCGASIFITRNENGAQISMPEVFDKSGNRLGSLISNGYQITKKDNLTVEHSGDLSTLIVHDKIGEELLYVKYLNAHAIRIRGLFVCPGRHMAVAITNDSIHVNSLSFSGGCSRHMNGLAVGP